MQIEPYSKHHIYPTFYLKKEAQIISGVGSKENSFQLAIQN